jgi:hypothetical protein
VGTAVGAAVAGAAVAGAAVAGAAVAGAAVAGTAVAGTVGEHAPRSIPQITIKPSNCMEIFFIFFSFFGRLISLMDVVNFTCLEKWYSTYSQPPPLKNPKYSGDFRFFSATVVDYPNNH